MARELANADAALLYQAAATRIGVLVRATSAQGGMARLGEVRRELAATEPAIAQLTFRRNPLAPDTEFFILRARPKGQADMTSPSPTPAPTSDSLGVDP